MANKINGNHDGAKGGNDTYTIPGREKNIPRNKLVKEVEAGKHPNHTTTEINGEKYVKAKPNSKTKDNVNK
ncbi:MAG: hypothetical protein MJK08_04050 [Campylobacterales bacterium]|nr:hypothetical protein [Campylobacterales bacterium]NQY53492.1 DUF3892 domain-containing protein [Campylobacteraceae bacterium]